MGKISNHQKTANFFGALAVKFVYYLAISIFFVLLFWWAGITGTFNWRYAFVMAVGLLFLRIFIAEIFVKSGRK